MSVYDNLIGQDHIIGTLKSAVEASRLGAETQEMTHSWLFTGPPGSGRSTAAVAFAQALICKESGCGICSDCLSALSGAHPDVEIIRTEGLSIKVEEIRELLTRVAWAPSLGGWRVVVMEDADRLTESAANALLKAIEEPGSRTVWLLCAPTLHDVLPTIRSRCRHLQLRTPSAQSVANILISNDRIEPNLAQLAARVTQGHIGRARYFATNESVQRNRKIIMQIPMQLNSLASALQAAQSLVDLATKEAETKSEIRDEEEIQQLQEAYGKGATGQGMASGASKAIKELEKEQKARATRFVRDSIDAALLDLATFYRDVLLVQSESPESLINSDLQHEVNQLASGSTAKSTTLKIDAILKTRSQLTQNSAPLLICEALMCELARK
ncbi:MAG: DNA polymerase III subunit delta' [Bacteroidetes bacterium]|nr:DNA polymerase III subunit delta' [bacterium]NBP64871.1 DNA polymerase III subunit delta' [Bacteroidota bacterium]